MLARLALLPWTTLPFLVVASPAHAGLGDECADDADCGDGLACEVVGGTGCACAEGASCEPCETTEIRACVPGPCADDDDCGEGLVCVSYEVGCATTAMPDCPPDVDCGAPREEEACEPTTQSVCAPRWVLPCEADADCGEGFACEAYEVCACSGGGPTEPARDPSEPSSGGGSDSGSGGGSSGGDDGAPMPPEEEDCTCEPADEKACTPKEVACDDDADCADGWTCARETTVSCTDAAEPGGEPGSEGSGDAEFMPREPECSEEPAPTSGTCVPDGWYGTPRGGGDDFAIPTDAQAVGESGNNDPSAPGDGATGGTNATPSSSCAAGGGGELALLGLALVALFMMRRRIA